MAYPKQRSSSLKRLTKLFRRQRTSSVQSKDNNNNNKNEDVLGGVYHTTTGSTRYLLGDKMNESSRTIDTRTSDYSESSSDSDGTTSTWNSSGSAQHHTGAPLLVRSAVSEKHINGALFLSDEEVLGRIMLKSRNLPRNNTGYFASNHVMINNERTKRTIVPLKRSRVLDEIARKHASHMSEEQTLSHANPTDLLLDESTRVACNVGRGSSVNSIHKHMMTNSVSDKNNIIDRRFVSMGVGTAKAADGTLYLCQIFSD